MAAPKESVRLGSEMARVASEVALRLAIPFLTSQRSTPLAKADILVTLGRLLQEIACDLQGSESVGQRVSQKRLHKFLRYLETVCMWPKRHDPSHSGLDRLKRRVLNPEHIAQSITAWSTSRNAKNHIACFKTFLTKISSPPLDDLYSDLGLIVEIPVPDAVSQLLYETITRNTLCFCTHSTPGSLRCFQGRLRLIEKTDCDQVNNYLFDTAFITRADVHESKPLRCQLMRFQVPMTLHRPFIGPEDVSIHESEGQDIPSVVQTLCHLARRDVGAAKLCLRIEGDQLVDNRIPVQLGDTEHRVKSVPSLPLAEVLHMQHLTTRDRLIIAYILARSVWQYYNTDWLNTLWTTDNIHFMIEEREDDRPEESAFNPARPYFAFADNEPATLISESVNCCAVHRYPRILALGTILVELFRKEPRHSGHDGSTLDAFLNDSLFYSSRTMRTDASWPHLDLDAAYKEDIRAAVAVCFDWNRLESAFSQSQNSAQTFHCRRDILWDEVVSRLQRICRVMKLINDDGAVIHGDSHALDRVALYQSSSQQQKVFRAAPGPKPSSLVALGSTSRTDKPACDWLERVQGSRLVETLMHSISASSHSRPIRIAILDSGYDATNDFFTYGRKRRIVAWRDFLKDTLEDIQNEEGHDSDGHGTDVLSMALRVAPFAEFCVARVFETSVNVASRVNEIARAIEWAVEDHDVDIISMSFGFAEDQLAIQTAITKAYSHKNRQILFFAGAANEGLNEREMYPARDEHVFPIRVTNHLGKWSGSNPEVEMAQGWSFMTLGQDLPSISRHESVTGSSYATPIAAGFAAMILAEVRRLLYASTSDRDVELIRRISRKDGMRKVLKNLSVGTIFQCSYLNPMSLDSKSEGERLDVFRSAI